MELKQYANSKGIEIIGDMPVYPVFESVETQYNPECFEMKNGKFTFEAGTPPDYFNENGQKWNSPVYNVKNIKIGSAKPNEIYDFCKKCNSDRACQLVLHFKL